MMRERNTTPHTTARIGQFLSPKRMLIDLGILIAIGLLLGFLAPFGFDRAPTGLRYAYWLMCMVGGGLIAIPGDAVLRLWLHKAWVRVAAGAVLLTPPVSLMVLLSEHLVMGGRLDWQGYSNLLWQVWPILLAVLIVLALVKRSPILKVETRTVFAPPLPEAEASFRLRLSAKRRSARLLAVQAHDHYLIVHTDAGEEMITLRFADALADLALAHGWQVHRSWWVCADAVEAVRWQRGIGEMRLVGGMTVPVSRTYGPVVKAAGWF